MLANFQRTFSIVFSTKHQHAVQRLIQSSTRSLCSGTIARSSFREVVVSPLGPLTEVDFWTICRLFHGCIQTYYCNEIHVKFKTSIFQHFSRSTRSSPYHTISFQVFVTSQHCTMQKLGQRDVFKLSHKSA